MGKLPRRRMKRAEEDQTGCMWGFISMFDFRRGRYNRRLLPDKRLGNRVLCGAVLSPKMMSSPKESDYKSDDDDCESTQPMLGARRPSVKKLMEQDMVVEGERKNNDDGVQNGNSDIECQGQKKSSKLNQKKQKHFSISSVMELKDFANDAAINNAVQEIYIRIQQKHNGRVLHENDLNNEFCVLSGEKQAEFEKQLTEAAEIIIHEKMISAVPHEKIHYSREFMDALETLISNKLLFFNLLEDPNSELTKHINYILNARQGNKGNQKNLDRSHSRKHRLFSRRRFRSQEVVMLTENEADETPSHNAVSNTDTGSETLPIPIAANSSAPSLKTKSIFSFTEIKRRLKHAMGKDKDIALTKNEIVKEVSRGNQVMKPGGDTILAKMFPSRNPHLGTEIHPTRLSSPRKSEVDSPSQQKILAERHVTLMHIDEGGNPKICNRQNTELARTGSSPTVSHTRSFTSPTTDKKMPSMEELLNINMDSETLVPDRNDNVAECPSAQSSIVTSSESDDTFSTKLESWDPSPIVSERKNFDKDGGSLYSVEMRPEAEVTSPEFNVNESTDSDTLKSAETLEVSDAMITIDSDEQEQNEESCVALSQIMLEESCLGSNKTELTDDVSSKGDKPSPISVLDPIYLEDITSPTSTENLQDELQVTPLQIHFDEDDSSESGNTFDLMSSDETESKRKYIQEILKLSGFSWDMVYLRSHASDQLLDSSLYNADVDILSDQPSNEYKLLFDCLNEVLMEWCTRYFVGSPLPSFSKHNIRPIPDNETAFKEIWQAVEWHLRPLVPPRSLEQMVQKDLAKDGRWMDLRFDSETIGYELENAILQEVLEETVLSCFSEDTEILTSSVYFIM